MKKTLGYILLTILFMGISSGPETLRSLMLEGRNTTYAWLMFFPSALFNLIAVAVINDRWLVPKTLLKNKFPSYFLYASIVSLAVSFLSSLTDSILKIHFDFHNRPSDGSIGPIILDSVANTFFLVLIMLGFALLELYDKWGNDLQQERLMSESLNKYIKDVRSCLNPATIFKEMGKISETIPYDRDNAVGLIDSLSEYLRKQLSELPSPPQLKESAYEKSLFSHMTTFLVSHRYRTSRYLIFLLTIGFISYSAFANAPSGADLDPVSNAIVLFCFLIIVSNIEIFWFFRKYEQDQDVDRYYRSILILSFITITPILISIVLLFAKNWIYGWIYLTFNSVVFLGGIIAISLYLFGLGSLLFFQNWIRVQRHITMLHNETLRQEYLFLRRQINPHFLFNVLNNIEISVYDDPDLASELLKDLIKLLECQLEDSKRDFTTLQDEIEFLTSYLSLEQSRRDRFRYEIKISDDIREISIPTLIFIPIVENAAKYSATNKECMNVKVSFRSAGGFLKFECRNPYDIEKIRKTSHHGIGLENTMRRLELLYDGKARISTFQSDNQYHVEVIIPIKIESI